MKLSELKKALDKIDIPDDHDPIVLISVMSLKSQKTVAWETPFSVCPTLLHGGEIEISITLDPKYMKDDEDYKDNPNPFYEEEKQNG